MGADGRITRLRYDPNCHRLRRHYSPFYFRPPEAGQENHLSDCRADYWLRAVLFPPCSKKMFYSKKGNISDVMEGNVADSGRFAMWKVFESRIKRKPWLGRGTGAGEALAIEITGGLVYPHNDWLLTLYDMGILGTGVFALSILIAAFHAWRMAKSANGETRSLLFAGAFSFVILTLMMFTDNIMVYASFFGNLQFTFLGLGYAAAGRTEYREKEERGDRIEERVIEE